MEQKLSVVGIDLAKQVFHHVGINEHGRILVCKTALLPTGDGLYRALRGEETRYNSVRRAPIQQRVHTNSQVNGGRLIAGAILFCNVTLNTVLPLCVSGMVTLVAPLKSPALVVTVTVLPCVIGLPFWSETM